jgi:geranylgeranyl diphosphate synthase type I
MPAVDSDFAAFAGAVRAVVEVRLRSWLDARVAVARRRGADTAAVAEALTELALRGGKRLRAVLLAASYVGCGGEGGADAVAMAGVSLELLQTYLLVHDDWMDGDDTRRGGPSVPFLMRSRFAGDSGTAPGTRRAGRAGRADAASVLAGDLASAWSRAALLEVDVAADRVVRASRELARAEEDVVEGQVLDVEGAARDAEGVELVHTLKSASYSTRAPVLMGARLAGAGDQAALQLAAFADPLGVAFQLRDDVLGTFGDAGSMGKPAGGDLRTGKRTALVVEAERDAGVRALLERLRADAVASDADLRAARAAIEKCGAKERVEARIAVLVARSRAALDQVELTPAGRSLLEGAVVALTERTA